METRQHGALKLAVLSVMSTVTERDLVSQANENGAAAFGYSPAYSAEPFLDFESITPERISQRSISIGGRLTYRSVTEPSTFTAFTHILANSYRR